MPSRRLLANIPKRRRFGTSEERGYTRKTGNDHDSSALIRIEHVTKTFRMGEVDVAVATKGRISSFVAERVKTHLPRVYLVTMPIVGRIDTVDLTEGTAVEKDQVVARMTPADLETTVREGQARVKEQRSESRANLEQRKRDQQRGTLRSPIDGVVLAPEKPPLPDLPFT